MLKRASQSVHSKAGGEGIRTIRHNQATIIHLLPIIKCLDRGRLAFLLGQVIIILHKVAHDKLAARLRPKQQPESERVEEPPEERVREVERECPVCWADDDGCQERAGDSVCR